MIQNQSSLKCIQCLKEYSISNRILCGCKGSLEVEHKDLDQNLIHTFEDRLKENPWGSGVWRYRELILPASDNKIISRNEGNTRLYNSRLINKFLNSDITLKHEGENPTGSFKDRGMTAAITAANMFDIKKVICASTGNTSASMASYAALAEMEAVVIIPSGKITYSKLAQALAYGAKTYAIDGDFDNAMNIVKQSTDNFYLLNSLNPFRIEGQKSIVFELLHQLKWEAPDWIILPGGNLGNNTAIAKGLLELKNLGIITTLPRIAVIQAQGANPLYEMWVSKSEFKPKLNPDTIATAIKIGNPVNWQKSLRGIKATNGVVEQVSDQEILDAKAIVDKAGIGAEPASCATVAGAKKLIDANIIKTDDIICGILTGNFLKDPDTAINYHKGNLDFQSRFANSIIETTVENLKEVIK